MFCQNIIKIPSDRSKVKDDVVQQRNVSRLAELVCRQNVSGQINGNFAAQCSWVEQRSENKDVQFGFFGSTNLL